MPNTYRSRSLFSIIVVIVFVVSHSANACQVADDKPSTGKPKNVLFIAVDDLKPLLGCYGDSHVHSPNIDRLANRGTVFLNAHCQQAVCGPSRVSLLTGLRPDTTRVYDLKTRFRDILPDAITIPQHFKANGYESIGLGKIFDPRSVDSRKQMDAISWSQPYLHPKSDSDDTLGYLNADVVTKIKALKSDGMKVRDEILEAVGKPATDAADVDDEAYEDGMIAKRAASLIEKMSGKDKPFFLAVGFRKPHLPFNAPKKYWDLYDREKLPQPTVHGLPTDGPEVAFQNSSELRSYQRLGDGSVSPEFQRELVHGYYACVSYIDAQVGKLLDAVDKAGIAEDTVIVLWGDHGWHLGDHGMWCKHTNFEQATRSPLIVVAPNVGQTGELSKSSVELTDVFPTLCQLTGIAAPEGLHGTSLVPVLNDHAASVKEVAISQYPRKLNKAPVMGYALRDLRYRYVEWHECDDSSSPGDGRVVARELYDYEKDPLETRNFVDDPSYHEVVKKMTKLYKELEVGRSSADNATHETVSQVGSTRLVGARVKNSPGQRKEQSSSDLEVVTQEDMKDIKYRHDEYLIHTNLWGARLMKDEVPDFSFEVVHSRKLDDPLEFRWDISKSFSAPIFPYIGFGDRMWKEPQSTTDRLPVRLDQLAKCDLHFDLEIDEPAMRKAKGNLAVDVWLGDKPSANESDTRTEVMLWFDRQDQYPIGAKNPQGTHEFGGVKWDLFTGELGTTGTKVCTFIAQKPIYKGTIDFMKPLDIVREKGLIENETYLGCFELGNEIYKGSGVTKVKRFVVDVRTKDSPGRIKKALRFNHKPYGKHVVKGAKGVDVKLKNVDTVVERTIRVRLQAEETMTRQVVYKEGGIANGLSIYIENNKICFATWNSDIENGRSLLSYDLPKRDDSSGGYFELAVAVSAEAGTMEGFFNGASLGEKKFFGLVGGRGTSTVAYSDTELIFRDGSKSKLGPFKGKIDEVLIFDYRLTAKQIQKMK